MGPDKLKARNILQLQEAASQLSEIRKMIVRAVNDYKNFTPRHIVTDKVEPIVISSSGRTSCSLTRESVRTVLDKYEELRNKDSA